MKGAQLSERSTTRSPSRFTRSTASDRTPSGASTNTWPTARGRASFQNVDATTGRAPGAARAKGIRTRRRERLCTDAGHYNEPAPRKKRPADESENVAWNDEIGSTLVH